VPAAAAGTPRCGKCDQFHLACQIAGQLLKRGADHTAGPAPGRPQIDDDGNLGGLRDLSEGCVVGVGDPRQRLMEK